MMTAGRFEPIRRRMHVGFDSPGSIASVIARKHRACDVAKAACLHHIDRRGPSGCSSSTRASVAIVASGSSSPRIYRAVNLLFRSPIRSIRVFFSKMSAAQASDVTDC
jgi:hypothetical protein